MMTHNGKIFVPEKKVAAKRKGQTWKWKVMSRKWINYVDPHLPLSKQTIPSAGITFLHMRQSFLE
jgi:hypothetical protein